MKVLFRSVASGLLAAACSTAKSEEVSACPVRVPVMTATLAVTVEQQTANGFQYAYSVANGAGSDFVDRVILLGVPSDATEYWPKDWFTLRPDNIVSWQPMKPYSGNDDVLGTALPSDGAIAPNSSLSGFGLKSTYSPGLLVYRLGARRSIAAEMSVLDQLHGISVNSSPPSEADENYESWAEEYADTCGANISIDRRIMVTGVVPGPSRFPVAQVAVVRDAAGKPLSFSMQVPAGVIGKVSDRSVVTLFNAELEKRIPTSSSLLSLAAGVPTLSFTVAQDSLSTFSCRSNSVLVEAATDGVPIFRGRLEGADLGLPPKCSR